MIDIFTIFGVIVIAVIIWVFILPLLSSSSDEYNIVEHNVFDEHESFEPLLSEEALKLIKQYESSKIDVDEYNRLKEENERLRHLAKTYANLAYRYSTASNISGFRLGIGIGLIISSILLTFYDYIFDIVVRLLSNMTYFNVLLMVLGMLSIISSFIHRRKSTAKSEEPSYTEYKEVDTTINSLEKSNNTVSNKTTISRHFYKMAILFGAVFLVLALTYAIDRELIYDFLVEYGTMLHIPKLPDYLLIGIYASIGIAIIVVTYILHRRKRVVLKEHIVETPAIEEEFEEVPRHVRICPFDDSVECDKIYCDPHCNIINKILRP